jgi:glycosyltransferase involved in cell wall biosynthesis
MKKILVISSYPAPYRVAVFQGLKQYYEMDIFFEFMEDQNRSADWFARGEEFRVLNTAENCQIFADCLKKIQEYDLVLAYDYNNKQARRLMRCAINRKVPYIINADGAFIHRHWLKDVVKTYYISRARACFASGEYAKKYFLTYGAKAENIYLHHFTSLNREDIVSHCPTTREKKILREQLGLEDRPTVLTIGQFIPRKGFDILLRAWQYMPQEMQLILIGGGDLEAEYQRQIQDLGLSHVYVSGFMDKKKIFSYYQAVDLFVLPTREDIWGLVINEAMACGLPVISTDRCIAAMEMIQDDVNGYIVPVEDVEALAEKMKKILTDSSLRQAMSEANLEKIQDYTLDQIVECHRRVIDQL